MGVPARHIIGSPPTTIMSEILALQKVAIITGASSGIGRQTAIVLSENKWRLVLTARRAIELEETAKLCTGYQPYTVPADITDERDVQRVFEAARTQYGRLDLLFNNAGMNSPAVPMEDLPVSKFQEVMNTNITGPFLCTREAFKMFKIQDPQGGRIINNGSMSAHTPRPHSVAYTASKHAITGLTKCTALDGRAFDIACTQIDIGNAQTSMTGRMQSGVMQPDGQLLPEATMDVQEIAKAILHIANLPNSVSILNIQIMATGMPFVGRG